MDRAKYSRKIEGAYDLDTDFFVSLAYDLALIARADDLPISMSVEVRQRDGEDGSRVRKTRDLTAITDGAVRYPDTVELMLHGDTAGGQAQYVLSVIAEANGEHFVYADADAGMAKQAFDAMVAAFETRRRKTLADRKADAAGTAPWKGSYGHATVIQATVAALTVLAFTRSIVFALCTLAIVVCARGLWGTVRRPSGPADRPVRMRTRSVIDLQAATPDADAPLLDHRPLAPLDLG